MEEAAANIMNKQTEEVSFNAHTASDSPAKLGTSSSEGARKSDDQNLRPEPQPQTSVPANTRSSESDDQQTEESRISPLIFVDTAPKTPRASSPSKNPDSPVEPEDEGGPTPEIKSIMQQFEVDSAGHPLPESRGLKEEGTLHVTQSPTFPLRGSSLELGASTASQDNRGSISQKDSDVEQQPVRDFQAKSNLPVRISSLPSQSSIGDTSSTTPTSPPPSLPLPKELPPTPDPEPDLPFDFHRFLEQLRHRTADPVAKYVRSFLTEFGKKSWTANEQEKFIRDFLAFIANKMSQCEVWRGVSDAEFDNAREGMEKLVMNRLYSQTFSPAIPPSPSIPTLRGRRKNVEKLLATGRRGQHQEDIERDDILSQKVRIYSWVEEEHLDIKPIGPSGRRLLSLAQQELLKIKNYRAPRDKVICILNSCKVIVGMLRNSKAADTSADSFVPLLLYVVLHANPDHLVSNVQYIMRFRNQEKLGGEAGYYLSSLMGAIQFIETLDRTSLTISDQEFEEKVEAAVSTIAERNQSETHHDERNPQQQRICEKSAYNEPDFVPPTNLGIEPRLTPQNVFREKFVPGPSRDGSEEDNAVNGLLRSIQRPLSNLGKIFSDESSSAIQPSARVASPPPPPQRLSPAVFQPPPPNNDFDSESPQTPALKQQTSIPPRNYKAEDAAARQASAEAAEAQRIQQAEHRNVVETLAGMFPNLDRDLIDDVVRVKQGRVGLAVDACLALNT